jgi:hypothetical protein
MSLALLVARRKFQSKTISLLWSWAVGTLHLSFDLDGLVAEEQAGGSTAD